MKNRDAETERRVEGFIAKFEARHQTVIRAVRKSLRGRFPAANEIVYDNYNFFVIGYGHTDRPTDCFVSIAAAANGVGLCFLQGASFRPAQSSTGFREADPVIRLPSADMLERPGSRRFCPSQPLNERDRHWRPDQASSLFSRCQRSNVRDGQLRKGGNNPILR